jgi:hypothetical protein
VQSRRETRYEVRKEEQSRRKEKVMQFRELIVIADISDSWPPI